MRNKRILAAVLAIAALTLTFFVPARANAAGADTSAQSAVLIEASTKRVLYYKEAHTKLPMASTTKVMTAILAIENCELDELVTTPEEAFGEEGSSIYLGRGEKLSLEDMLFGLMLRSGNDAAVAIAVHVGGSVEGFVDMMNAKAMDLGCLNTHFVTPNGLPDDEHYTTAYDLALITAYAFENEEFTRIASSQYHRAETGEYVRAMKNKNKLLWQYDGALGGKTGYTKAAGKCLAFASERDRMRLVGVVLNCPDMFADAMGLMDMGYKNYRMETVARAGDSLISAVVSGGEKYLLELCCTQDIIIPVSREGELLDMRVTAEHGARAPIQAGTAMGSVSVYLDGALLLSCPLTAASGVEKAPFKQFWRRAVNGWTA